jgi:hypothetical protein
VIPGAVKSLVVKGPEPRHPPGHLRKQINPLLGDMLVSQVVAGDTDRLVTRLTN